MGIKNGEKSLGFLLEIFLHFFAIWLKITMRFGMIYLLNWANLEWCACFWRGKVKADECNGNGREKNAASG